MTNDKTVDKTLILLILTAAIIPANYPEYCKEYESSRSLSKEAFFCQGARVEKLLERIAVAAEKKA